MATPKHKLIKYKPKNKYNSTRETKTAQSAASMSIVPTVMCSIAVIALTQTGPLWYIDIHIATLKIVTQEVTTPAR